MRHNCLYHGLIDGLFIYKIYSMYDVFNTQLIVERAVTKYLHLLSILDTVCYPYLYHIAYTSREGLMLPYT